MPRRSDSTTALGSHVEVFVIEKRPTDKRLLKFAFDNDQGISVQELIEKICKELKITPVHSALFGICLASPDHSFDQFGGKFYLPYSKVLKRDDLSKKKNLYFRLQYKVVECGLLRNDPNAFSYYLLQCRHDFVHGQFKENLLQIPDEMGKQEMLLRMLILEMLLVSKDENMTKKDGASHLHQIFKRRHPFSIEDVLTKYIDERSKNRNEEVKKCKRIIEKSLQMFNNVEKPEMDFVREVGFLPEFSREVFDLVKVYGIGEDTVRDQVLLSIHPTEGVARMRLIDDRFKKIEEKTPFSKISHLVIKKNELNPNAPKYQLIIGKRDSQQAEVVSSDSEGDLLSLCSWIDGYYRLLVDQYTCLFEETEKRTRTQLEREEGSSVGSSRRMVHGPIDRSVAVQLLESMKCTKGDYLIRSHRQKHGAFVITVRTKDKFEHHEFVKDNSCTWKEFLAKLKPADYFKRIIQPAVTGPVPFMSDFFKTMPALKREVPLSKLNQLLSSKSVIKEQELSKGYFGSVWRCKLRRETGLSSVVVRFLQNDEITQSAFDKICRLYVNISSRMIVRIVGQSEIMDNPRFLACEFMNGGPLNKYLAENRENIRYKTLLKYFSEITEGMMYLELELKLVHGNLNCHNVLCMENEGIKISDACFYPVLQSEGILSPKAIDASCNWRAPEVLKGEPLTHSADVWSLGMTIWEMMSLSVPFAPTTKNELLLILQQGIRPSFDVLPYCPAALKEILKSCWKPNPGERENFQRIFDHLERYRRGGGCTVKLEGVETTLPSEVPTFLMNRHYYNWKQEEANEVMEQEKLIADKTKVLQRAFSNGTGSSGSINTGSSSSSSGAWMVAQSSGSHSESMSSGDSAASAAMLLNRIHVSEDSGVASLVTSQDIEMQGSCIADTKHPRNLTDSEPDERGSLLGPIRRSKKRFKSNDEEDSKMAFQDSNDADSLSKTKNPRFSSEGSLVIDEQSDNEMEQDTDLKEPWPNHAKQISNTKALHTVKPSKDRTDIESTQGQGNQTDESVTEDVMEVANVLASLASHHGSDRKGQSSSMNPREKAVEILETSSASNVFFLQQKQSMDSASKTPGRIVPPREQLESGYYSSISGHGSVILDAVNQARKQELNATQTIILSNDPPPEFESIERKRRSHSLSEEITKMQKKAAKRALDRPNPFNLGACIPKNFLLPQKEPITIRPQNQPGEMSKFFNDIPQKYAPAFSEGLEIQDIQLHDEQVYKTTSDISTLEDKLASMKAASPLATSSAGMKESNSKIPIAQSLAYVVSSSQPIVNQTADASAIQATINAYLTNLGQSLVAGNPILVPQITVNASPGQPVASTAQLLQLLQAQQKAGQLSNSNTQEDYLQPKPSAEAQPYITAPNYLQTLLALVASKNMMATAASTSQQPKIVPASTVMQQQQYVTRILAATTQAMSTTVNPLMSKSQELVKKVVDIKPKPTVSTVDLTKNENEVLVVPSSMRGSLKQSYARTNSASSSGYHTLEESRMLLTQRSASLKPTAAITNARTMSFDSKLQMTRPLNPQSVRTPPLILPKNLPEQLGKIEHSKETKIAPKPPNFPLANLKVEPTSPHEIKSTNLQGYVLDAATAFGSDRSEQQPLSADKIRGFSDKLLRVQNRRTSEESGEEHQKRFFAQLGGLKIFKKKDLKFVKKLGEGLFGEVWQAILCYQGKSHGSVENCPVAVKKLKPDKDRQLQILEEFKNEVKQMASLENDYIVKLIGISIDPGGELNDPWIITEWMPHGSLEQFIVKQRKTIVEEILLKFAVQIAEGMEFLQSRCIVHRDLATRNVLVESRDRVKVCDFGLSRMFGEKDYYRSQNYQGPVPIRWYAPESISHQKFTPKSDVWSYGVTLWEMFELWGSENEHATPYKNKECREILDFLVNEGRLSRPNRCRNELWQLILGCWNSTPEERFSFYILYSEIKRLISQFFDHDIAMT